MSKCILLSLDTSTTDKMIKEIYSLVCKYRPDIIVVEGLTVFNHIKTDTNLSDIIGACRGFANITDAWFDKLFPNDWRSLCSDGIEKIPTKRNDCKPWDMKKVNELYSIQTDNDNIADAVLIGNAYCKLFSGE